MAMIQKSASIIVKKRKEKKVLVVVSSMSWINDILINLCNLAAEGKLKKVSKIIGVLSKKHKDIARKLYSDNCKIDFSYELDKYTNDLLDVLRDISLLKKISSKYKAKVLYVWEIFSSFLLSIAIDSLWYKSRVCYSKEILSCYWDFMDWECDCSISEKNLKHFRKKVNFDKEIPIITWFWGGDKDWNIYLFDRGGSDYVATLIWTLLKVEKVEIRTDVDWVYSADPKVVKDPIFWDKLDYGVASEFSLVRNKVLHPRTIFPAKKSKIKIIIKNTLFPERKWTTICKLKDTWIKWINIDSKQVILTFVDPSMICSSGYMSNIINVFKNNNVSIDTISTTETSFSFSIREKFYKKCLIKDLEWLDEKFELKIYKKVSKISIIWDTIDNSNILNKLNNIIMISYWAYGKSLTIFIKEWNSKKIILDLHRYIFNTNKNNK